jgi:hypothetical protein
MEECYFGHHFNGVSPFCTECGVRLMDDDHIEFNRIQMVNKPSEIDYNEWLKGNEE